MCGIDMNKIGIIEGGISVDHRGQISHCHFPASFKRKSPFCALLLSDAVYKLTMIQHNNKSAKEDCHNERSNHRYEDRGRRAGKRRPVLERS